MPVFCIDCAKIGKNKVCTYGLKGSNITEYCAPCGKKYKNYVDVKNKMCEDCKFTIANFGEKGTKIPICCSACNKSNHDSIYINVKDKMCEDCGLVSPIFGKPGSKIRICCKACNIKFHNSEYVNVKTYKLCKDCNLLRPTFGESNTKIAICCGTCNSKYHNGKYVDVKTKMCEDCGLVQPCYGLVGTKIRICCKACNIKYHNGKYVDVKTKMCEDCGLVQPCYGLAGTKIRICCKACNIKYHNGKYVDIINKLCQKCSLIQPRYGKPETKIAICCKKCNDLYFDGKYVDVLNNKCINEWCDIQVNNNKYKGYCFNCFRHEYPNHKFVLNYKSKELLVVDSVKAREYKIYKDGIKVDTRIINWKFDKPIGRSKRRPDIFYKFDNYYLLVDIDENQHRRYDCEDDRLIQLLQDAGMNIVIIRFNPDTYIDHKGRKVQSCFHNTINGTKLVKKNLEDWEYRLQILHYYIQKFIRYSPTKLLTVLKLFYDGYNYHINYFENL